MSKTGWKLGGEFKKLLPPTIYFFVALHIVVYIRVLMLKDTGLSPMTSASVAVAALIMGKAVLLADMIPGINRFPEQPLAQVRPQKSRTAGNQYSHVHAPARFPSLGLITSRYVLPMP